MVGLGRFHPHPNPAKKVWLRGDPDPAKKVWLRGDPDPAKKAWLRGDPDPQTCHEGRKSLIEGTLLMINYFIGIFKYFSTEKPCL